MKVSTEKREYNHPVRKLLKERELADNPDKICHSSYQLLLSTHPIGSSNLKIWDCCLHNLKILNTPPQTEVPDLIRPNGITGKTT